MSDFLTVIKWLKYIVFYHQIIMQGQNGSFYRSYFLIVDDLGKVRNDSMRVRRVIHEPERGMADVYSVLVLVWRKFLS